MDKCFFYRRKSILCTRNGEVCWNNIKNDMYRYQGSFFVYATTCCWKLTQLMTRLINIGHNTSTKSNLFSKKIILKVILASPTMQVFENRNKIINIFGIYSISVVNISKGSFIFYYIPRLIGLKLLCLL